NPNIQAAQAGLRQAQEFVYAQQGFFYPTLNASYQFQRNAVAGNFANSVAPGVQGSGKVIAAFQDPVNKPHNETLYYNVHTAQLSISYMPDVFGLNRRTVESLEAQAAVQRFALEATYITLATNVVAAAIQEAYVRAEIAAVKEIIAFNQEALDILRNQFRLGYVMRIDVAAQEAALAQAKQLLPPLEQQLDQTRDMIRALVGNLPNEDVAETIDLDKLELPQDLPVSLPSKIIEQRPDVRAAEELVRAANAQVGVAIANRLPQFPISAAYGGTATQISQIFYQGGPFWNIVAGAVGTIFDGNTLLHQERAADEALVQAAAQYRSTVLVAYQNVADSLHILVSDADALQAALEWERAAKVTLDLTREQLNNGYVNYLTLIGAELTYQQALLSLIQAQGMRFGDTAALFQALGGGWWNRKETDPSMAKMAPVAAAVPAPAGLPGSSSPRFWDAILPWR
ncbi:MAG: efflux transporter outer membrane subunit, partial [Alphaproteobacteria bacterium]|nr:efflux transporter outer membrane subunit [Alphaproteobacteria bacterium]